jgi:hypothetical protein
MVELLQGGKDGQFQGNILLGNAHRGAQVLQVPASRSVRPGRGQRDLVRDSGIRLGRGMGSVTALQLQRLLDRAGLSQRGAAKALEINERSMRRYCSGEQPVPKTVELALLYLASQSDGSGDANG